MTTVPSSDTIPGRLLLATDLSARCDRALDRAAQLSLEWKAELIALNVLDPGIAPDQVLAWANGDTDDQLFQVARQQLARDLKSIDVVAKVRIVRGADATAAILATASETASGLVITGVSRSEILGRLLLGSTVESLARALPVPLLVVRNRAYRAYKHVVVATDFSEPSRRGLQTAARYFPGRELILYHARAGRMSGLSDASAAVPCDARTSIEKRECGAFVDQTTLPEATKVRTVVECGAIETALTRYVRAHDVELVVMGSRGCSNVMNLLLDGTAAKLLDWLPCDILLVR